MSIRAFSRFWALILFLACTWCSAAPKLSYATVKSLYKEGEFGKIQTYLEKFLKDAGSAAEDKEKIFAFKYLGVTYAADSEGAHLAAIYFYDLLELAPNAYLSDLYVSTAVQDLFDKTKARYLKETRDRDLYDEFGNPRTHPPDKKPPGMKDTSNTVAQPVHPSNPDHPKNPQPEVSSQHKVWPWIVVGTGVAAGIGVYLWISNLKAKTKVIQARVTEVTIPFGNLN